MNYTNYREQNKLMRFVLGAALGLATLSFTPAPSWSAPVTAEENARATIEMVKEVKTEQARAKYLVKWSKSPTPMNDKDLDEPVLKQELEEIEDVTSSHFMWVQTLRLEPKNVDQHIVGYEVPRSNSDNLRAALEVYDDASSMHAASQLMSAENFEKMVVKADENYEIPPWDAPKEDFVDGPEELRLVHYLKHVSKSDVFDLAANAVKRGRYVNLNHAKHALLELAMERHYMQRPIEIELDIYPARGLKFKLPQNIDKHIDGWQVSTKNGYVHVKFEGYPYGVKEALKAFFAMNGITYDEPTLIHSLVLSQTYRWGLAETYDTSYPWIPEDGKIKFFTIFIQPDT